jgi:hypothetical protein
MPRRPQPGKAVCAFYKQMFWCSKAAVLRNQRDFADAVNNYIEKKLGETS